LKQVKIGTNNLMTRCQEKKHFQPNIVLTQQLVPVGMNSSKQNSSR
jgi:hypothetical protein